MTWHHLEMIFNRSMIRSLSRAKFFLVFFTLSLCGLISVIYRAASIGASQMTHLLYIEGGPSFVVVMRWFFLFNFACETRLFLEEQTRASS